MISVAMATWNSGIYLEEQLESIMKQTRVVDEVIIVDDASQNDTVSRLYAFIEKNNLANWKVIARKTNQGYIKTFRQALKSCRGDLIFLCDHDDIWMPDKVEKMEKIFTTTPGMEALLSSFTPIDGDGNPISKPCSRRKANHNLIRRSVEKNALNQMCFQDLAAYNLSPGCTALISARLKHKYLTFEGNLPHDWALYAIAALDHGLFYYDVPYIQYRLHDSNTLGLTRQKAYEKRKQISLTDYRQKQALMKLVTQFHASRKDADYMQKVERIYGGRYLALQKKSRLDLISLFPESFSIPFLYETLAADLAAMMKG